MADYWDVTELADGRRLGRHQGTSAFAQPNWPRRLPPDSRQTAEGWLGDQHATQPVNEQFDDATKGEGNCHIYFWLEKYLSFYISL